MTRVFAPLHLLINMATNVHSIGFLMFWSLVAVGLFRLTAR